MLKRIFTGLFVFFLIAVAAAYLLPRQVHVERSLVIAASAETIFPHIDSPRMFNEWSPWANKDPNIKMTYSGPESGVGATMTWQSDDQNVGSGTSEIIESIENELTRQQLDFGDHGGGVSFLRLEAGANDTTVVVWGFDTDLGMNPIARYMGLMFDSWIGTDYEFGLANLKDMVEKP